MLAHTCKKSSSEEEKCVTAGLTGKLPKRRLFWESSKVNIAAQGYILLLYFFTYKIKGHLFKGNSLEGFNCFVHLNEKTLVEKKNMYKLHSTMLALSKGCSGRTI